MGELKALKSLPGWGNWQLAHRRRALPGTEEQGQR